MISPQPRGSGWQLLACRGRYLPHHCRLLCSVFELASRTTSNSPHFPDACDFNQSDSGAQPIRRGVPFRFLWRQTLSDVNLPLTTSTAGRNHDSGDVPKMLARHSGLPLRAFQIAMRTKRSPTQRLNGILLVDACSARRSKIMSIFSRQTSGPQ